MATKPNPNSIRRFLELVVGNVPEGHYALFWTLPAKRSIWAKTIDDELVETLAREAETADHVYMGVGLCRHDMGPTLRAKADEISGIFGLWADIDVKGAGHKKANLPPDEAAARELLAEMGATPTIVVRSGHGLQAYWLFREPWIFEKDEERKAAASLSERWTKTLRIRAKAKGFDIDATHDLARVLRVPGTINKKTLPHVLADFVDSLPPDARYDSNDFDQWMLVDAEKSDEKMASFTWTFTLNAAAEPPAEKFALLCQYESKFHQTYKRERSDFQDQSASSYDLALATRAMVVGWNEQEIVNLLISFRRKHGEDLKLREDYYRRTLNKAMTGKAQELRAKYTEELREGKPLPKHVKEDPAECFKIVSDLLKVRITKLLKVLGSPNRYEMEIGGQQVTIGPMETLQSQVKFAARVADSIAKVIEPQKPKAWREILQYMLDGVQIVDPGKEATDRGSVEGWLREYLSGRCFEEDKWNDALEHDVPVMKGERIFFKFSAFKKHIRTYQHERIGQTELSQELAMIPGHVDEGPQNYKPKRGERSTRELRSVPKSFLSLI